MLVVSIVCQVRWYLDRQLADVVEEAPTTAAPGAVSGDKFCYIHLRVLLRLR
jgi:hypothetical protein